jgi:hypothetical protein
MRDSLHPAVRFQLLAWTLVALLFGTGETHHLILVHHSVDDAEVPTCSVCKMSEHNLGDLSLAGVSGEAADQESWLLEPADFAGIVSLAPSVPSPRAPPRA